MRVDRICYEQLFPTGVYANQRYRAEAEFQAGDDFSECFKILKSAVEKTFIELNPSIMWEVGEHKLEVRYSEPTNEDQKEDATQRMITAINSCTELKVLETFKLLVKNNPVFQEAYNNKLKSFQ